MQQSAPIVTPPRPKHYPSIGQLRSAIESGWRTTPHPNPNGQRPPAIRGHTGLVTEVREVLTADPLHRANRGPVHHGVARGSLEEPFHRRLEPMITRRAAPKYRRCPDAPRPWGTQARHRPMGEDCRLRAGQGLFAAGLVGLGRLRKMMTTSRTEDAMPSSWAAASCSIRTIDSGSRAPKRRAR